MSSRCNRYTRVPALERRDSGAQQAGSVHVLTAVDGQSRSGNESSIIRNQERHPASNFVGFTEAANRAELEQQVYAISARTGRYLERQGLLVRDQDNSYLALEPAGETRLEGVLGSSITYRIAVGPQQGRKVFSL